MTNTEHKDEPGDAFTTPSDADSSNQVFKTFRDRDCALWQSVVEDVTAKENAKVKAGDNVYYGVSPAYRRTQLRSFRAVSDATKTAEENSRSVPSTGKEKIFYGAQPVAKGGIIDEIKDCSGMAFQLAYARATGSTAEANALSQKLHKEFATCDPKWSECIAEFVKYFTFEREKIPYRDGQDNILNTILPKQATIGIIGDWGTGTPEAVTLLEELAEKKPDILIHLGDIYYTGLQTEVSKWFLDICKSTVPGIPVYSLAGNHDMYSGGEGYYWLVDQLDQRASYFCLQNDDWQFVAIDTGFNDFSPFSVSSAITKLNNSEAHWAKKTIQAGAARGLRTCLLSHHQPFSAFEEIGGGPANEQLISQLKGSLPNVDLWVWGHEHRLDVYDEYRGVKRGRCLGCSAIPVFTQSDYFDRKFQEVPLLSNPNTGEQVKLGVDGNFYKLAYAVMKLDGKNATVDYLEVGNTTPLFTDVI